MRKRRGRSESSETLVSRPEVEEKVGEGNVGKVGKRFFACYLLVSLSPRHKGHTYIGFTVNPRRRIRQHNGEIGSGAWRTKRKRPWEMVLCIYGFPSNVSALQFEWAWQHPNESLAVRKAAASFKSVSGIANKIKLAYTMLTLPAWQSLNITVNYFSTKYTNHYAGCPSLPEHMRVQVCPMDELPCYSELIDVSLSENEDEWDNKEECDGGWSASGYVQETILDSMVQNSSDNESNVDKMTECLYEGGNEHEEDCAQPFSFINSELIDVSLSENEDEWDNKEECDGGSCASGYVQEETILDSMVQNSLYDNIERTVECLDEGGNEHEEDCAQSSSFIKSVMAASSSIAASAFSLEEVAEERDMNEAVSVELPLPVVMAGYPSQRPSSSYVAPHHVEIIDVSTPSPDCRTSLCGKKRRICPQIIDLTKSPAFIQL